MYLIDHLFSKVRASPFLYRVALFTRCLLAAGFIPTGAVKLMGQRFTTISVESPIGAFFEAMYQTGLYWKFLGLCQITAGLLLLVPRLAHIGALMFLPIMGNIFVITLSLEFRGTPYVTGLMLLAVGFLCFWDFHRLRPILTERPLTVPISEHRLDKLEMTGFTVWAFAFIVFFGSLRSSWNPGGWLATFSIYLGLLAGLFTLFRFLWCWRNQRLSLSEKVTGASVQGP